MASAKSVFLSLAGMGRERRETIIKRKNNHRQHVCVRETSSDYYFLRSNGKWIELLVRAHRPNLFVPYRFYLMRTLWRVHQCMHIQIEHPRTWLKVATNKQETCEGSCDGPSLQSPLPFRETHSIFRAYSTAQINV